MHNLSLFIANNMGLVYFIYGLAFFSLGLVILVQPREESRYEIPQFIWLLASFGMLHGTMEWLDIWELTWGNSSALSLLKVIFLFVSYVFLFEFGRRLTRSICSKISSVRNLARKMLGLPIYGMVALGFLFEILMIPDTMLAITIASRYFLGFTGSSLVGTGLLLSIKRSLPQQEGKSELSWSVKYFVLAAMAFFFYGLLGGLVVPAANVMPANVINSQWFLATFQFPVQLFRATCAVSAAIAVGNIMRVFHLEARTRLSSSLKLAKEGEAKLLEITSILSEGVYVVDRDGLVTFANPEAEKLLGWTATELMGRNGRDTFHFKRPDGTLIPFESCPIHQTLKTGDTCRSSGDWMVRKDGSIIPVSIVSSPILRDGKTAGSVIAFHDIAEHKRAEEELRIAAKAFESQECMFITDGQGVIRRVNSAFTDITGYSDVEAVGQKPTLLKSGRHNAEFYAGIWGKLHQDGYWRGEIWNRRKNGEIFPAWQTITAVTAADGQVANYVSAFTDISRLKKTEDQVYQLAFYDPLTHLPNRRMLLDRLGQALALSERKNQQGALLFIDLDHFKNINDTQGHHVGDQMLIEVAKRMQSCIRETDTAARMGGDEFVVLLEDLDADGTIAATQASAVAEKIRNAIEQAWSFNGREQHSTASIGISLFRGQMQTTEEMLKRADFALYHAKELGRNTSCFFDPALQVAVNARVTLEEDLRTAIMASQFTLLYQPQIGGNNELTGVEVLVRWQHPRHGIVAPADFIPLSEELGLILPIGQWVLETACTQLAAWATRAEMAHLTIAVNVSAHQFRRPDFVEQVISVIERTRANPHKLKLEITESLLLGNIDDVVTKMTALKARGVSFSLDDFGTGYSSLSYLKRLPLDQLKIDRSFVRDILTDPNDAAITRTIVALARSMGLETIAEGVETLEQRDFLVLHDCHAFQGYLFCKPVSIEQFEVYASQHKA